MNASVIRLLCAGSLLVVQVAVEAACPSFSNRFTANADGSQVTDSRTGLVWARCSAGQTWNGANACTGTAIGYTHEAALTYAQSQSGWRLPNAKEQASLSDKGCLNPAIDATWFPNTQSQWYWSASPYVGSSNVAWYVYFANGYVDYSNRDLSLYVRLVRASQ